MPVRSVPTVFAVSHLSSGLHLGADHTLLELGVGIKDLWAASAEAGEMRHGAFQVVKERFALQSNCRMLCSQTAERSAVCLLSALRRDVSTLSATTLPPDRSNLTQPR